MSGTHRFTGLLVALFSLSWANFLIQHAYGADAVPRCKPSGPTPDQLNNFTSQLSSPSTLVSRPTYQAAASLIADGLSNGTEPVYILPTPSFVVVPNTPEDVVAAVQFAADSCLKVAARGTGHQLAGLSLAEAGVTISMQNLRNLSFDSTTSYATVQLGASSGLVDEALLPYGRLPLVGTCPHVGVAGFTLQGGDGWAAQWHGAGADFVQSLDVVVVGPDRKAVRKNVTAQSDPDLFFGLRGAGGNLGVVIAFTTMTFPVPATVQLSYYSVAIDKAQEVLSWWGPFFAKAPPSIAPDIQFNSAGSDPVNGANIVIGSFNVGPATSDTDAYFRQLDAYLRPRSFLAPNNSLFSEQISYLDFATDEDICGDLTFATYWNTYYTANGTLRTGELSPDLVATMIEEIKRSNSSTATLTINAGPTLPTGEAAQYFSPNAWSFRDSYQIFVGDTWGREAGLSAAEQDLEKILWVKEASAAVKPYVVGNYINQLMMEDPDDARKSYEAGIFERLTAVKAAADPHNLFRDLNYLHEN